MKDIVSNRLDATEPGAGLVRFPDWLEDWFYAELCVEIRTEKGWEKPHKARNESWDLLYYCVGICLADQLQVAKLNWNKERTWYSDWDDNVLILSAEANTRFAIPVKKKYDIAGLAKQLA